ncbi:hypothetical protein Hypma_004447 [Hypsizygus marmoreus]|uniref:Uncharacterized protein n=1 Tax=Hypsizygus marmoreus TaxID=39966 RepID=A0A369K3W6_HYPMA|nr:hypothetical protein Hypma_004447 [Hypsizygus marmoreus]
MNQFEAFDQETLFLILSIPDILWILGTLPNWLDKQKKGPFEINSLQIRLPVFSYIATDIRPADKPFIVIILHTSSLQFDRSTSGRQDGRVNAPIHTVLFPGLYKYSRQSNYLQ